MAALGQMSPNVVESPTIATMVSHALPSSVIEESAISSRQLNIHRAVKIANAL
jgi:hypothetical protein